MKFKFELVACLEEVWRNTLSGVDCSFLDKDNSAVVCLIRYASILLPGVYDISVKGGRHSADVRMIKYINTNDDGMIHNFTPRGTVEATCINSSIEDKHDFETADSFMGWSVSEDIITELNSVTKNDNDW